MILSSVSPTNSLHGQTEVFFFPRTIVTWNRLTNEAVSAKTVDGFKTSVNIGLGRKMARMPVLEDCL